MRTAAGDQARGRTPTAGLAELEAGVAGAEARARPARRLPARVRGIPEVPRRSSRRAAHLQAIPKRVVETAVRHVARKRFRLVTLYTPLTKSAATEVTIVRVKDECGAGARRPTTWSGREGEIPRRAPCCKLNPPGLGKIVDRWTKTKYGFVELPATLQIRNSDGHYIYAAKQWHRTTSLSESLP